MCAYAEKLKESARWLISGYASNVRGDMIEKVMQPFLAGYCL